MEETLSIKLYFINLYRIFYMNIHKIKETSAKNAIKILMPKRQFFISGDLDLEPLPALNVITA